MDAIQLTNMYILNTYNRYPIVFKKGKKQYLFDINGKKYLDMSSGIAVTSIGHSNKEIAKAISKQAKKLIHTSNLYYNEPSAKLAKILVEKTIFNKVFFCNSGAEANEGCIKLARKYGKTIGGENKYKILSFKSSFHGRTIATITATGQEKYQTPFTPLLPGVYYGEYNNIESVKKIFDDSFCAIIVEPIQGEGGVRKAEYDFIKGLRELCDKHNALLIFDEVQTGVGRTGKLFCYEHFLPIKPDLMSVAKGIAGGLPMGVMFVSEKLENVLQPGDHASTFGGNLLSSVAAIEVLKYIEKKDLLNNVTRIGNYFKEQLLKLKNSFNSIKEVRGEGFLLGIEIDFPSSELVKELIENGIVTVPAGPSVVRFLPPLIIKKQHIDFVINILEKILKKRGV